MHLTVKQLKNRDPGSGWQSSTATPSGNSGSVAAPLADLELTMDHFEAAIEEIQPDEDRGGGRFEGTTTFD